MSKYTTGDHRFAKAFRVNLGEPLPALNDADMDGEIISAMERRREFEGCGEDPTIRDWQEYADQMERESLSYYRNWQIAQNDIRRLKSHNQTLRYGLLASIFSSFVLVAVGIVQWWYRPT